MKLLNKTNNTNMEQMNMNHKKQIENISTNHTLEINLMKNKLMPNISINIPQPQC